MRTKRLFMQAMAFGAWFFCQAMVANAQAPKSEKELPIFPGAVRDAEKESEAKSDMAWELDPSLRSSVLKWYRTNASCEDVFAFYLQKLGGKEGSITEDPMALKPGTTSAVWYEVEYYSDEDLQDTPIEHDVIHPGKWMKQKLIENRKPHKPGKWITEVKFNWYNKESNNDLTTFYLIIYDDSFERASERIYQTNTQIQMQITTNKSEQAMQDEEEAQSAAAVEALAKSLKSKPPTEKELGVPIYPGSQFNADFSAGLTAGNDYALYIYLTVDEPAKVVDYYQQHLKIKATEPLDGKYLLPLKGKLPLPEEGISIEPNIMFGGKAKTVIAIQKKIR